MQSSNRKTTRIFLTALLVFTFCCGQMTKSERNTLIAEQSFIDGIDSFSKGEKEEAISNLKIAISLDPSDTRAQNALDWIYQLLKEENKIDPPSLEDSNLNDELIDKEEEDIDKIMLLSSLSEGLEAFRDGDYELMLDALDTAVDFTEKGSDMYFEASVNRMLALALNEEYEESMDQADELLDIDPTSLEVLTMSSWAAYYAGYGEDSLGFAQTAYDLYPDNPVVKNNLAYAWAVDGENLDKAYELVSLALEAEPGHPSFLDTKGWILYQQGNSEAALPYIEEALEGAIFDPDIKEVKEHLKIIMEELDGSR
jgi:tetratricopeptide (TPR) repeat protein